MVCDQKLSTRLAHILVDAIQIYRGKPSFNFGIECDDNGHCAGEKKPDDKISQ